MADRPSVRGISVESATARFSGGVGELGARNSARSVPLAGEAGGRSRVGTGGRLSGDATGALVGGDTGRVEDLVVERVPEFLRHNPRHHAAHRRADTQQVAFPIVRYEPPQDDLRRRHRQDCSADDLGHFPGHVFLPRAARRGTSRGTLGASTSAEPGAKSNAGIDSLESRASPVSIATVSPSDAARAPNRASAGAASAVSSASATTISGGGSCDEKRGETAFRTAERAPHDRLRPGINRYRDVLPASRAGGDDHAALRIPSFPQAHRASSDSVASSRRACLDRLRAAEEGGRCRRPSGARVRRTASANAR